MHTNRHNLFASLGCGVLAALACVTFAQSARADDQSVDPVKDAAQDTRSAPAPAPNDEPRRPRGGQRGMPLAPDWPRAGGFGSGHEQPILEGIVVEEMMNAQGGRRELTDEDVTRAVAVAKLVSAEWGSVLEARAKSEPAQLRASLRAGGRRLLGLVALQERAPEVFDAKVAELRAQAVTSRAASEMRRAHDNTDNGAAPDPAKLAALQADLDAATAAQVDAALTMRRAEYSALATRLDKMKADIDADARNREKLAAALKDQALAPRDPPRDPRFEDGRDPPRDPPRDPRREPPAAPPRE